MLQTKFLICTNANNHYFGVEVNSDLTRGMTLVDQLNAAGNARNRAIWAQHGAPSRIFWAIDVARWKAALFQALA